MKATVKKWALSIVLFTSTIIISVAQSNTIITIPTAGNSFEISEGNKTNAVGKHAISIHRENKNKISSYFKLQNSGWISIYIIAKTQTGKKSTLTVSFKDKTQKIKVNSSNYARYFVGKYFIHHAGYQQFNFINSTAPIEVEAIELQGEATQNGVIFCNDPASYYWSRRGPSCHLTFETKENNISYYYNEITVPKGNDIIGSYFMAIGFAEGYFGIQVNSPTERRILFSVWSPYQTDDPKSIPEDQKIKLNKKGESVYTGEFGNEGSGGQSYWRYNWVADSTYQFLLKGVPDQMGNTDYTAWFFAPELNEWKLIASFKRPKTDTYLKRFHSFLENFNPENGYITRQVYYTNQWVYNGTWTNPTTAKLSVDATFRNNHRIDATGGVTNKGYFLKMGGFFDDVEKPGTVFQQMLTPKMPIINFSKLP